MKDEESFIISSDSEDERHHSTSSDDENVTIVVPDSSDEATNTSVDYGPANGRITPLIHKAIRRSLRHFEKSSDDETENMSTEDLTQSPMPERKNSPRTKTASRKSYNSEDSSDDEYDTERTTQSAPSRQENSPDSELDDSIIQVRPKHRLQISSDEENESHVISSDEYDNRPHKSHVISSDERDDSPHESDVISSDEADVSMAKAVNSAIKNKTQHFIDSVHVERKNSPRIKTASRKSYNSEDSSDDEYDTERTTQSAPSRQENSPDSELDDSIIQVRPKHRLQISSDEDNESHVISSDEYDNRPHKSHVISSDERDDSPHESDVISSDEADVSMAKAVNSAIKNKTQHFIDSVHVEKEYLEAYLHQLKRQLTKLKMLVNSGQPDKGEKIQQDIITLEKGLALMNQHLGRIENKKKESSGTQAVNKSLFKEGSLDIDPSFLKPTTSTREDDFGKKALETFQREQVLTAERLKDLHGSLVSRPMENQLAEDPRGLKVKLMPHQKYALTWLLWREQQNPPGGVLADDMGLGKTITMISFVLAAKHIKNAAGDSDDEEKKGLSSARTQRHLGGTLVVAPASLVAQWQSEVKNRCKNGLLTMELYHGNNRESNPKRLARNDIVVTTYNILSREAKTSGVLYKIHWKRVVLDEAHVIRNHKSQTCEAVCSVSASKRWVLTGTPVHNKEMDLFSLLKFLKCSPFDDVRVWKRWVDNKNVAGSKRLLTVMKSIMLRRTKQELQANGLDSLPDKAIETIEVKLDPDERLVYDKVLVFSRTLFAQFLAQRAEKAHMNELGAGKYDKPSWQSSYKDTQFTKAQKKLLSMHADVATHEILVLLLRLRQLCCHPSLIHAMLDQQDIEDNGLEGLEDPTRLAKRLTDMSLHEDDDEDEGEIGVDERVVEDLLTSQNPVFNPKRQSSKLKAVLEKIQEIVTDNDDKIVVVSQWTSVLELVANELKHMKNVSFRMFTGKVPIKDRQGIVDDFNSRYSKMNVLLLSLTAGGVGLNLVGANHLLLMDIHWNPQLENQAQDRIYRFGQKKDVYIYKYICSDTIEERIKGLQEHKLSIADSLLSCNGKVATSKLSLDEMKTLFGM